MNYLLKFICAMLGLSLLLSCKSNEPSIEKSTEKPVRIANDELEYEVIILDIGFNRFLNAQAQPRGFYTLNFLEIKNNFFITQYNIRANNPLQWGNMYGPPINYQFHIEYGYEVNYLLYNYFLFFQQKYRQRL